MTRTFALLWLWASLGCAETGPAGLCDVCQTLSDACFENTPGIGSLQPGTRETIRCFDAARNEIPCICCDDPGRPSCDPPQCRQGLECHLATDGKQHCFALRSNGSIDGVCP
jgi:hypothetical protein